LRHRTRHGPRRPRGPPTRVRAQVPALTMKAPSRMDARGGAAPVPSTRIGFSLPGSQIAPVPGDERSMALLTCRRSRAASAAAGPDTGSLLVGTFFLNSLYLQHVLDVSALETGLGLLPLALSIGAAAHVASRLPTRRRDSRCWPSRPPSRGVTSVGSLATCDPPSTGTCASRRDRRGNGTCRAARSAASQAPCPGLSLSLLPDHSHAPNRPKEGIRTND
jgi:hypothetical protein